MDGSFARPRPLSGAVADVAASAPVNRLTQILYRVSASAPCRSLLRSHASLPWVPSFSIPWIPRGIGIQPAEGEITKAGFSLAGTVNSLSQLGSPALPASMAFLARPTDSIALVRELVNVYVYSNSKLERIFPTST